MFEDFNKKQSVVIAYTGEGKGKTSASLGLMVRALGADWRVAYVQFVKVWEVNEHKAIRKMQSVFKDKLTLYKGGKGFYDAGEMSASNVTEAEHKKAAQCTLKFALDAVSSDDYQLVICDEINNAVHDGLITENAIKELVSRRAPNTNLCLTGRDFPKNLIGLTDIATNMTKLKHHFDDKFLAINGIDY